MPRNSLPVPRCKSYRKIYIKAASVVVKNRSSLRDTAGNHNLHYSILQRYIKSNGKKPKIDGQTVLIEKVKKIIV